MMDALFTAVMLGDPDPVSKEEDLPKALKEFIANTEAEWPCRTTTTSRR